MRKERVWELPQAVISVRRARPALLRHAYIHADVTLSTPAIPEEMYQEWRNILLQEFQKGKQAIIVRVSARQFVLRHCEEVSPLGPWRVLRFSWKGKKYTSLLDDIYGYASIPKEAWPPEDRCEFCNHLKGYTEDPCRCQIITEGNQQV